jgi:peptide/nickel transport system ATP-binding protein
MVFQDPLSSLDPRQSVESLLVEGMQAHGLAKNAKEARPRLRELLKAVGLPGAGPDEVSRTSSPEANGSASASPAPCPSTPSSSSPTSRSAPSTSRSRPRSSTSSRTSRTSTASPTSSSRTTSPSCGTSATASASCTSAGLVEEAGCRRPLRPAPASRTPARCSPPCRSRTRTIEDTREQILLTGDLPSPSNPATPGAASTPAARGARRPAATTSGPRCAWWQIDGVDPSHRVACHWVEQIASGEIRPHEVAPVYVAPGDGDAGAIDDDTFTGPASVTEVI